MCYFAAVIHFKRELYDRHTIHYEPGRAGAILL